MALQSSGQISISNICGELGASTSNASLASLSTATNNTDACNTSILPGSNAAPHGMSEFYNYDHSCTSITCTSFRIAGPFGDMQEACDVGPISSTFTAYHSNSAACPIVGDYVATTSSCYPYQAAGWYYSTTCGEYLEIGTNGLIRSMGACLAGGGGGTPPRDLGTR